MANGERERAARNRDLLARLAAPPTKAQVLAELDLEISGATELAVALDFRPVVRLLRMAKQEVSLLRRQRDTKE
jgi:hypothetical protein